MSLTQINKAGLDEIALDHVFTIGASGTDHYTFQGEGLNGTVNDPTLYLTRGKTYRFENGTGAHAIRIQSADDGTSGTLYNTGVTNNNTTGTVIVEVQHDAPDVLYYQCASHANMKGTIYITGALADGSVTSAKLASNSVNSGKIADGTVSTNKLANDAVTATKLADQAVDTNAIQNSAVLTSKIADGQINTLKLANGAVTETKIADEAVTLAKLEHGTSSNNGKFLRANNGADPTFETITGTTINNNADNRVITGSGTANTLEGESNLTFDGTNLNVGNTFTAHAAADNLVIGTTSGSNGMTILTSSATGNIFFNDGSGNAAAIQYIHSDSPEAMRFNSAGQFEFDVNGTEKVRIDDYGVIRVGNTHDQTTSGNTKRIALGAKGSIWGWSSGQVNGALTLADNYYWDGSNNKAIESDYSAYLSLRSGSMRFGCTAASQTGGNNISGGIHEKVRFANNGNVEIADGNLVVANGHGIDFSATANSSGGNQAELLDDYEEGTFAAHGYDSSGNAFSGGLTGKYTKIGNRVHISIFFFAYGGTANKTMGSFRNLPFTGVSEPHATGVICRFSGGNHANIEHEESCYLSQGGTQIRMKNNYGTGSSKNNVLSLTYMTTA